jgi:hypothetical protein
MGSLSGQEDRDANRTVGKLCALHYQGGYSEEDIARELDFDTVEDMRNQLQNWDLPGWLVGEESETNPTKKTRKKGDRRARNLAPLNELPPAGNSTELFKELLEALLESAELLKTHE